MPILVLDDDAAIRVLHAKVLGRAGHEVDTGDNGDAGWKALQAKQYDLLITDNDMPKMSGEELIQKIRSESMVLPIILATGSPPTTVEPLQLAAVLLKPFTAEQLLDTVKEVLQGRRPPEKPLSEPPASSAMTANE